MVTDSTDRQVLQSSAMAAAVISELVVDEPSIGQVLERLVGLVTQLIEHAEGASVTIYRPDLKPATMVASHDWVRDVDNLQYRTLQGPCIEVAGTSAPTSGSADLEKSSAWPVFGPAAAGLGVRAVLAVALSARPDPSEPNSPPGALNLYSRSPFAFTAREREKALVLAAVAGVVVQMVAARTDASRLREALSSRDVIGQAKGILMERHGVDEAEAFAILRRASNDLNIKLRDVAAQVATRGDRPGTMPENSDAARRRQGNVGRQTPRGSGDARRD